MEKLFTKKETADYQKVSERTVSRNIAKGDIPVFYVGRQVRIPETSVKMILRGPMSKEENDKIVNDILEI